jgi:hypothetical protein
MNDVLISALELAAEHFHPDSPAGRKILTFLDHLADGDPQALRLWESQLRAAAQRAADIYDRRLALRSGEMESD